MARTLRQKEDEVIDVLNRGHLSRKDCLPIRLCTINFTVLKSSSKSFVGSTVQHCGFVLFMVVWLCSRYHS